MTYKKRFSSPNTNGQLSPISGFRASGSDSYSNANFGYNNYRFQLPEVYTGHPNRVERYNQYEAMDIDPEISACLDIIAEFSTQKNEHNNTPFNIEYKEDPTPHEVALITKQLQQWTKLNEFHTRIFKVFRNTLKYGDQVFIRDPETFKLYWVDMTKVSKVIVNESEGKLPEQYVIKDINPNLQNLTVAEKTSLDFAATPSTAGFNSPTNYTAPNTSGASSGSRFALGLNEAAIDANHIMHLSLTEGLDRYWPFGQSILESVYKVYKQKELLEDAILIYRVQRAPERRVFKIDVGNMPSHLAMAFVDRVKNEVHQRRIPSSGGGQSILDASYSPMAMNEDFYFPQTSDGRGSSVEVLPGGSALGEIADLKYFSVRLARGLRVPSSYLPSDQEEAPAAFNDGRVGTAMIQEHRFNQYCERLQNYISQKLDTEFKLFLRWRGFNIDAGLFDLQFNAPQNFAAYRQSELDTTRVGTFAQMEGFPYISKRFALQRFLGLTEEEVAENERMWNEEREDNDESSVSGSDLRSIGISGGDLTSDLESAESLDMDEPMDDGSTAPQEITQDTGMDQTPPPPPSAA